MLVKLQALKDVLTQVKTVDGQPETLDPASGFVKYLNKKNKIFF